LSPSIPCSVARIDVNCFCECRSLAIVTFESHSNLSSIERSAFANCYSLSAICIHSSLQSILSVYGTLLKII
jgi:hypothetical protein